MTQDKLFWYGLLREGLSAHQLRSLYELVQREQPEGMDALRRLLATSTGVNRRKVLSCLQRSRSRREAHRTETRRLSRTHTAILMRGEALYPNRFTELPDPPVLLFARGNLSLLNDRTFGMVGARKCTDYGRRCATAFGAALARAGVTVVSGLAMGIDACSQRSALAAGGGVVAVLGNGLNQRYPACNGALQRHLAADGLVLSEYHPDRRPRPHQFLERNRLIAALSDRIMVVEAGVRSGSLNTAQVALELGRDVLAVPGDIDRSSSEGTNRLLADGAIPVLSSSDLED